MIRTFIVWEPLMVICINSKISQFVWKFEPFIFLHYLIFKLNALLFHNKLVINLKYPHWWIFWSCWPLSGNIDPLIFGLQDCLQMAWQYYFFFLRLSPLSSIRWDVWTILSRIASDNVSSPITACQLATGNWLAMIVEHLACLSSMISIRSILCCWSRFTRPKSSPL